MTILAAVLFLFFSISENRDISKINELKKQAQDAYLKKDYAIAAEKYKKLIDDFQVEDEHVIINLANAYYALKDTANASLHYYKAVSSSNKSIKSQALSQLGIMEHNKKNLNGSLAFFKEALKSDPANEEARFNYELVKKNINNQKNKDQEDKNNEEDDKLQPSEFAKKLKEQADQLINSRKYGEAFDLMMKGLQQDQTVSYYKDFISRINDIIEIEK
jgi:tetratricopeptide (TPR) repeat protein